MLSKMNFEKGVVYVSTGAASHAEMVISIKSLKRHNPDLPVAVFAEVTPESLGLSVDFFELIEKPYHSIKDKCSNLWKTPFQQSLFLDSDTFITESLDDLFRLLERYDFCGAHETARGQWYKSSLKAESKYRSVPDAFPDINGGVLLFKKTDSVMSLLTSWPDHHACNADHFSPAPDPSSRLYITDQLSLRWLLWSNADIILGVFPTEYNALRYWGTYLWGKAIIVHGRGDIEKIATQMNCHMNQNRVYLQGCGTWPPFRQVKVSTGIHFVLRLLAEFMMSNLCHIKRLFGLRN
jgi:hypothetical protein